MVQKFRPFSDIYRINTKKENFTIREDRMTRLINQREENFL